MPGYLVRDPDRSLAHRRWDPWPLSARQLSKYACASHALPAQDRDVGSRRRRMIQVMSAKVPMAAKGFVVRRDINTAS